MTNPERSISVCKPGYRFCVITVLEFQATWSACDNRAQFTICDNHVFPKPIQNWKLLSKVQKEYKKT